MRKNLNILFIIIFALIVGAISLFNYIVDPYNILIDRPPELCLYSYPKDLFSAVVKLSKKSKYETLVFGASTTDAFLNFNLFPQNHVMMTSGYITADTLKDYIKFFVKNHPELKTVIFDIEYASYYFDRKDNFPPIKSENLTIKEIARLFLSIDSTIASIDKFKKDPSKILNKERLKYRNKRSEIEDQTNTYSIFNNPDITDKKDIQDIKYGVFTKRNYNHYLKRLKPDIIKYLDEYIEFFEENNINVIYIFPAYHAMMQSKIYKDFDYQQIEEIKRHLANKTKSRIIDFAYINKYTTEDLDKTYLYVDFIHPYSYKYNFYYCVLNNIQKYKNKDVYVELTKENIEDILAEQRKRLKEYVEQNSEKIDLFLSYKINNDFINKSYKNAPDCSSY